MPIVFCIALIIIPLSLMSRRKGRGSKTFTFGGSVWDVSKILFGGPSVVQLVLEGVTDKIKFL